MSDFPLETWVLSLSETALSEVLESLHVNPDGSVGVRRDRLVRHCRRTAGVGDVAWEPEDEGAFARGSLQTEATVDWISAPMAEAGPQVREREYSGVVVSCAVTTAIFTLSRPTTCVASTASTCSVTSVYGATVQSTAYSVPTTIPAADLRQWYSVCGLGRAESTAREAPRNEMWRADGINESPVTRFLPQSATSTAVEPREERFATFERATVPTTVPASAIPCESVNVEPVHYAPPHDIGGIVRRWNLKFSGATGQSAEEFLARLADWRDLSPISDEDLLRAIPVLLSGIALHWCRLYRSEWRTWDDFCNAFRQRFGDVSFQRRLREQLHTRTQGSKERVADYLTCLRGIYDHLERPPGLEDQLDLAYDHLRPEYRRSIRRSEVANFRELLQRAQELEGVWDAAHDYRPPPPADRSVLPEYGYREEVTEGRSSRKAFAKGARDSVSDLAAVKVATERGSPPSSPKKAKQKGNSSVRECKNSAARSTSPLELAAMVAAAVKTALATRSEGVTVGTPAGSKRTTSNPGPNVICWNCGEKGHRFANCAKTLVRFCYRCGKPGEISISCSQCSGNREGEKR